MSIASSNQSSPGSSARDTNAPVKVDQQADRTPDTGQDTTARCLTAHQAAERLGVHERTIRRAIARGDLIASKQGGVFWITAEALDHYRAQQNTAARAPGSRSKPELLRSAHDVASGPMLTVVGAEPQLPAPVREPLNALVGREREVVELGDLVLRPDVRLVTLTGPGGVGKTRLALAVAAKLGADFPDGVSFVDLSPLRDPHLVVPAIADTLGVWETGRRPLRDQLCAVLSQRELLLILDNCEQVLEAAPAYVDLLVACPGVQILATSRAPLRLSAEHEYALSPLPLPASALADADLTQNDAVRLFARRARAVLPTFALTGENAATVAAICRQLDGLPLAIELAAARIRLLPVDALLTRLERRLPLLTEGPRDAPPRQRTLRDAIGWSHELLSEDEQRLFRRLSVFVGGFTLDAAERVWALQSPQADGAIPAAPRPSVLALIASLIEKSLVIQAADTGNEPHYTMLETVREYGLERLAASGEEDVTRQAHADWCLEFAETAWRSLYLEPLRLAELDRVDHEHNNLRAALAWFEQRRDGPCCLQLASALCPYWVFRGHRAEGLSWLQRSLALAAAEASMTAMRARALHGLGHLAHAQSMAGEADEESLRLWRELGDDWGIAAAEQALTHCANDRGDYDRATALAKEALARFERLGNKERVADLRWELGRAAFGRGEVHRAAADLETSLTIAREIDDPLALGRALQALGLVNIDLGEDAVAAARFHEALAIWLQVSWQDQFAHCLAGVATLVASHHPPFAARLFGMVGGLQEVLGYDLGLPEQARYERAEAAVRSALGATAFASAWTAGNALRIEEAAAETTALLLSFLNPSVAASPTPGSAYGLTPREIEVLQLLGKRLTDREIADALFISSKTAGNHVSNILAKLGVADRREAAARAISLGLA